jgi:hypothetical protein
MREDEESRHSLRRALKMDNDIVEHAKRPFSPPLIDLLEACFDSI